MTNDQGDSRRLFVRVMQILALVAGALWLGVLVIAFMEWRSGAPEWRVGARLDTVIASVGTLALMSAMLLTSVAMRVVPVRVSRRRYTLAFVLIALSFAATAFQFRRAF